MEKIEYFKRFLDAMDVESVGSGRFLYKPTGELLKIEWRKEVIEDLRAFHGLDAETEITNMLVSIIWKEICDKIDSQKLSIFKEKQDE